jgi:hypothetical protein
VKVLKLLFQSMKLAANQKTKNPRLLPTAIYTYVAIWLLRPEYLGLAQEYPLGYPNL